MPAEDDHEWTKRHQRYYQVDANVGRLVGRVRTPGRAQDHAVTAHLVDDPRAGVDAGQRAGEVAGRDAEVHHIAEPGHSHEPGEVEQRRRGTVEPNLGALETGGLGQGADDVEHPDQDGADDHRAGHRPVWVLRLEPERCSALEADESEDGDHDPRADSGGGHALEGQSVRRDPLPREDDREEHQDDRHRNRLEDEGYPRR